jgi:hypothetical protein
MPPCDPNLSQPLGNHRSFTSRVASAAGRLRSNGLTGSYALELSWGRATACQAPGCTNSGWEMIASTTSAFSAQTDSGATRNAVLRTRVATQRSRSGERPFCIATRSARSRSFAVASLCRLRLTTSCRFQQTAHVSILQTVMAPAAVSRFEDRYRRL